MPVSHPEARAPVLEGNACLWTDLACTKRMEERIDE
jgi:hypothetical protein